MKKLNDLIQKIPGLNSSYHIGGSYFRNEPDESALWELRLKPLPREYLRGLDAEKHRDELEKSESIDGFVSSIHTAFGSNDSSGQK
jgi:hypothetical protein